jgi:hypothetical protein
MMDASFEERRAALVQLLLRPPTAVVAETFTDGPALFDAVCRLGLEGVVAKRLSSPLPHEQRGWVKTKNPTTGVGTPSARRWNVHASNIRERSSSSVRPLSRSAYCGLPSGYGSCSLSPPESDSQEYGPWQLGQGGSDLIDDVSSS